MLAIPHHSISGFYIELYQEHLEEVSFLYEQHTLLAGESQQGLLKWDALADFESRLEAHLDALIVGEEMAWNVCQDRAESGDFGELFAAVCVVCRRNALHSTWNWVKNTIYTLDAEEQDDYAARLEAVAAAFCHEMPESWKPFLVQEADTYDVRFVYILARCSAFHAWPLADVLRAMILNTSDKSVEVLLFGALSRTNDPQTQSFLFNKGLNNEQILVQEKASLGLLRVGDLQMLGRLNAFLPHQSWAWLHLGMAGGRNEQLWISHAINQGTHTPEAYFALGLLGAPESLPILLQGLDNTKTAFHAALGLYALTGAPLFEEQVIPDEPKGEEDIGEDFEEDFGDDSEDEEAVPQTALGICQDRQTWQTWLNEHHALFQSGTFYRCGQPVSPMALLQLIAMSETPALLRQCCIEELAIRYKIHTPLHPSDWVHQQRAHIQTCYEGIQRNASVAAGKRYFAAHIIA
jgi:hypothetical protein